MATHAETGISPSVTRGAWWGPPPGRSRHPHMALRFRGSVLRPAENYRVTCADESIARSARTPPSTAVRFLDRSPMPNRAETGISPSATGGAWWGPPSGRSRHPHMALRFRGSVLRLAENYRVTCAGGRVARSVKPGKRRRSTGSHRSTIRRYGSSGAAHGGASRRLTPQTPHSARSPEGGRLRLGELHRVACAAAKCRPRGEGGASRRAAAVGARLDRGLLPRFGPVLTRRRGGSTRCRAPKAGATRRSPGTRRRPRRRSAGLPGTSPPRRKPPARRRRPRRG